MCWRNAWKRQQNPAVPCHQTCAYAFVSAYNPWYHTLQTEWMNEWTSERPTRCTTSFVCNAQCAHTQHIHKRTHRVIWMVFGPSFHFRFHFSMCTSSPPPTSSHTSIYSNQPYESDCRVPPFCCCYVLLQLSVEWFGEGGGGLVVFRFVSFLFHALITLLQIDALCACACLPNPPDCLHHLHGIYVACV